MSVDSEVKQQGCASVFPRRESRPGDAADRPRKQEGAGKAGRWPRPWPASKQKSWRQTPQVWPKHPGLPCAMVLTLIAGSPRGPGLIAPVITRLVTARLGLSVGRPGPHAFASVPGSFVGAETALRADTSIASRAQRPWRSRSAPPESAGRREDKHIFWFS